MSPFSPFCPLYYVCLRIFDDSVAYSNNCTTTTAPVLHPLCLLARPLACSLSPLCSLRMTHALVWHAFWVWCARSPGTSLLPASERRIPTETRKRGIKTQRKPNRATAHHASSPAAVSPLLECSRLDPPRLARPPMLPASTSPPWIRASTMPRYLRAWIRLWVSVCRPLAPLCACPRLVSRPSTTSTLRHALVWPVLPGTAPRPYPTSTILYCASTQPTSTLGYVLHYATSHVPHTLSLTHLSHVCVH